MDFQVNPKARFPWTCLKQMSLGIPEFQSQSLRQSRILVQHILLFGMQDLWGVGDVECGMILASVLKANLSLERSSMDKYHALACMHARKHMGFGVPQRACGVEALITQQETQRVAPSRICSATQVHETESVRSTAYHGEMSHLCIGQNLSSFKRVNTTTP